jgi:hypothetical protein
MTTFDDRKDAFEKKHAHDQELAFKATARRNKLLGQWVAGQLGLSGAEAEAYAKDVVAADFEEAGDADVIRKVQGDLKAKGIEVSEHRLQAKLAELLTEAQKQLSA